MESRNRAWGRPKQYAACLGSGAAPPRNAVGDFDGDRRDAQGSETEGRRAPRCRGSFELRHVTQITFFPRRDTEATSAF
jgi:hypothetical protein